MTDLVTLPDGVVTDDLLQQTIVQLLVGRTGAGVNVIGVRDIPTPEAAMPVLFVQSPTEEKKNINGRNGPAQFNVRGTFRIVGRAFAKAGTGDAGAAAALAAVGLLKRQAEVCIINADELWDLVQAFGDVRAISDVKRSEAHYGEFVMDLELEYYQGPEAFADLAADPIAQMQVFADLVNVFDPTGDYSGSQEAQLFPAAISPAPRSTGPDGRAEAELVIDFAGAPGDLDFSEPGNPLLPLV